jgi:PPOX class probable F420-dependent enzyme
MNDRLTDRAYLLVYRPLFAILATKNADGSIWQGFIWYLLIEDETNGDTVLLNTTKKRPQYHNIVRDPYVSLCIGERYQYVTIEGHCQIVDEKETALRDIVRLATRYDGAEAAQWFHDTICIHQERVSLFVSVEKVHEYWGVDSRRLLNQ